ncbi:hypothetical protein CRG98_022607 [Punica granatum]|uniref:Uncharacterized protein n=1 Tax=Punica granatum TaxID=22663 RepID=A0A2I0JL54_PUNGR|nr:hypothetical protein CRG98_022607 [Punica granatum]
MVNGVPSFGRKSPVGAGGPKWGADNWSSKTVPAYAWFSVLLGKPLTRVGGSQYKGVNSLKSSEDLWGPVRWHSRLDPFPYSEPLTNLASYFWSSWDFEQANGIEPKPSKSLQRSRKAVSTRISSHRGTHARAYATRLESVHHPEDARRSRVRRSCHLPFYDPKVEGRQVTRV